MHKRKRNCMAFRPCVSQAFLEDRLVLNGGAVGVSSPIQAIATVSPSTASSAVSAAKQALVAASPSQSGLAISNSNQFTGSTRTGSTGAGSAGTGSTGVESTDTGIATTIVGSTLALPTPFDNSLQNSTSNVENLYDIPATVAINLPTGQLPGIAGTPNSALGYWGYTDGFDNGFYDFVSETESDPDYFNSLNPGFSMLKDSFTSSFSFPQLTQPTQGPSTGTGTGGLGTGIGGLGGLGISIGGSGVGHLRFGNTGKGDTGLGARSAAVSTAAILAARNSAAAVPPPEPRAAAVPPPEPRAAAVPPHPSHRPRRPRHPSHRPRRPRHPSPAGGPGTPATGRDGPGTPATGRGGPGTPTTGGPAIPATGPGGPGTPATSRGDPATGTHGQRRSRHRTHGQRRQRCSPSRNRRPLTRSVPRQNATDDPQPRPLRAGDSCFRLPMIRLRAPIDRLLGCRTEAYHVQVASSWGSGIRVMGGKTRAGKGTSLKFTMGPEPRTSDVPFLPFRGPASRTPSHNG